MDSTEEASSPISTTPNAADAKESTEIRTSIALSAGTNEGETAVRQRRKEKIMQSREDRLAKILSMASGRTVDPREVHLDRTPSPSISEVAAAGIGPMPKTPTNETVTASSPVSSLRVHPRYNLARLTPGQQGRHTIVVLLAATLFTLWWAYWSGTRLSSSFEPWQVAFSVFFVIQTVEYTCGRLHPVTLLSDSALFGFGILVLGRLLAL